MKFSMIEQETGVLVRQVTAWTGLTMYFSVEIQS